MGRGSVIAERAGRPGRTARLALLAAAISMGVVGWAQAQTGDATGDAGAAPAGSAWTPELPPPWRELPAIATRATAEARQAGEAAGVTGLDFRARVWGDPGVGVFLLVADVMVGNHSHDPHGASDLLEREVRTVLASMGLQPVAMDPGAPVAGEGSSDAGLVSGEPGASVTTGFRLHAASERIQARLRVRMVHGAERTDVVAAACFDTQREPEHAARVCLELLTRFEAATADSGEEAR